jgi:CheY-like chemotaxis protein/two-component sensor histidine kinase
VIGMLDLLLRSDLDSQQRERTSVARKSAEHLLSLLNDILDLSKLEADRVTLEAVAINPSRIARDVIILMSAVAEERGLRLFMSLDGDVPDWVSGDSNRLRQILTNLVGNALKFTDTGSVELRLGYAARDGGILSVAVRDTGIGIPDATRAELFTRFAQLESGKRGGTGLGLAICKQLVELMGGEIEVDSVEGLGSTFRFWIPAPPAASPEAAAGPRDALPRRDLAAGCRTARILVAEDNATNQKVLLAYLEMAGNDAHLTSNGEEVVAAAQAGTYDLVLMDIQMPVLDGIEATRRIRALGGEAARMPIIALTANAEPGDRERFLAAGIDDYLTKPVAMTALFEAIGRALKGYSASTGAQPSPGSKLSIAPAIASVSSPRSAS